MELIASIDQGTQSTRCVLYDKQARVVAAAQKEHTQIFPKAGWVEHDPLEIWANTKEVTRQAVGDALAKGGQHEEVCVRAVGVTNQRETVVVWDKRTGKPLHNAIVWLDTRTKPIVDEIVQKFGSADHFRPVVGLPVNTYFSAVKVKWLLDNAPGVKEAVESGEAVFGTIDSWLIWNLTGGACGGVHVTDVTNANRTMLMDLNTRQWSDQMLTLFGVPKHSLPQIRSSSEVYGTVSGLDLPALDGVPVAGCLGDQQAACVGQGLFSAGQVKCTYGTGAFILMNTGTELVQSTHGLLTTPCYQMGPDQPVVWAVEGSIAIAGAAVSWLRNNLAAIEDPKDTERLIESLEDTEGVFFVPAFSGLFAPRWRQDARGCVVGITQATTKAHIVRALFEAVCFQLREVVEAMLRDMKQDSVPLLRVDGGMTKNRAFMQLTADIVHTTVEKPDNPEVTSVGAAFAAGLAVKFWGSLEEVQRLNKGNDTWQPAKSQEWLKGKVENWNVAVERSLNWV